MSDYSLAILPFSDLGIEQKQRYLCDGLAAELIAALSNLEGLKVATRGASFRMRGAKDAAEAGRELGVAAVLQGTVDRTDDRLRVQARLVSSRDGAELWSETFDRPLQDVFAIQHEIAERIAKALELQVAPELARALQDPPTANVEAYEYYLKGRQRFFEYRRRGVEAALQLFNMALMLDHDYARAYAGVAESSIFLYMYADGDKTDLEQAELASRRALELAPELAEAHVARGLVLSIQDRFEESDEAFETAIRLNPRLFEAFYFYARNSFAKGDLESAAKLYGHASRIDPDDYQAPLLVAQIYDDLGRSEEALLVRRRGVRAAELRLQLDPEESRALYMGANALVSLGETERGIRWAEKALELEPSEPMVLYNVACVFSLAGEADRALDCLEKAVSDRPAYVDWVRHDSNLDSIREDPRFLALLEERDPDSA